MFKNIFLAAALFFGTLTCAHGQQSVVDASQPPFNAKADFGVTDNSVAIQAAVNYVEASGGAGTVEIPAAPGFYCFKSPVVLHNPSVRIIFLGKQAIAAACNADISLFVMQNAQQEIDGGWLLGTNFPGCAPRLCTTGFGATKPVVQIAQGCVACKLLNDNIWGGRGVAIQGSDNTLDNTTVSFSYGDLLAFGGNIPSGNAVLKRVSLDTQWPANTFPAANTPLNAWAAGQAYSAGSVVTLDGYAIQATQAGTSGSVAPTLAGYAINMADNSVIWQLAANMNGCGLRMDTGSSEVYGHLVDITGAQSFGVCASNTASGAAPFYMKLTDFIVSQTINSGMLLTAGHDFYFVGGTVAGGFAPYVASIQYAGAFQGNSSVVGGTITGGHYGVLLQAGSDVTLANTNISASIASAVFAMTSKFIINGNHLAAPVYGVQVYGASDYYNIIGNECGTATAGCINDGGTGTHKSVSLNQ